MCEFEETAFDIAAAAGWYSAIAGLLAGFAMLAILLPLDHETRDQSDEAEYTSSNGIIVFTSAFFALLVLSFTYAILSGRGPGAAALHEQQLGGAAFGLSSLLMITGLREVLRLYGGNRRILQPTNALIARVTGILGPILVVSFSFSNAFDVAMFRASKAPDGVPCVAGLPPGVWLNIAICALAVALILLIPVAGRYLNLDTTGPAMIGHVTLGFTVLFAVWTAAVVPFLSDEFVGGAMLEHTILVITAVGSVVFGATAWFSRGAPDHTLENGAYPPNQVE